MVVPSSAVERISTQPPCAWTISRSFQQAGLLNCRRGEIPILDRTGIEEASCECYGVVKKQFEKALGKGMG
jgi:hypothetical protein